MNSKEQYREICKQHNDIPLFIKDWWLDAVCDSWDVAIVMNGDKVAGVWPYNTEVKAGVSIIRNPVLTPYMGPHVFFPHDLKPSKRDNFEHEVTEELYRQIQAKVWSVALVPGQNQVGMFTANGFTVIPRQTFIMPLQEEETVIFLRLHEDYRRNIRKAETELSITNEPALLPELWEYQKATLDKKDVHMHFSRQQLQKVFDACLKNNNAALWVARKEGVVQAILWHIWDETRAYYLVGSKNPATKDNRAMTALIWKSISESKKAGKLSFDFEGSMDEGVEKFFRNFGGERTLYLSLKKNNSILWKLKQKLTG